MLPKFESSRLRAALRSSAPKRNAFSFLRNQRRLRDGLLERFPPPPFFLPFFPASQIFRTPRIAADVPARSTSSIIFSTPGAGDPCLTRVRYGDGT